jgi:hypothetical protein
MTFSATRRMAIRRQAGGLPGVMPSEGGRAVSTAGARSSCEAPLSPPPRAGSARWTTALCPAASMSPVSGSPPRRLLRARAASRHRTGTLPPTGGHRRCPSPSCGQGELAGTGAILERAGGRGRGRGSCPQDAGCRLPTLPGLRSGVATGYVSPLLRLRGTFPALLGGRPQQEVKGSQLRLHWRLPVSRLGAVLLRGRSKRGTTHQGLAAEPTPEIRNCRAQERCRQGFLYVIAFTSSG